ncbi:MAG: hypothetical protein IJP39_03750, partial [Bacteroidales bacterium]|nr:hypothetical protein [Bacteroidales bacterium]
MNLELFIPQSCLPAALIPRNRKNHMDDFTIFIVSPLSLKNGVYVFLICNNILNKGTKKTSRGR